MTQRRSLDLVVRDGLAQSEASRPLERLPDRHGLGHAFGAESAAVRSLVFDAAAQFGIFL